jgi:hypothetical protein
VISNEIDVSLQAQGKRKSTVEASKKPEHSEENMRKKNTRAQYEPIYKPEERIFPWAGRL